LVVFQRSGQLRLQIGGDAQKLDTRQLRIGCALDSHRVGDNRKTAPLLARSRGFNGGI
jgi:hypothetical protein